MGDALFITFGRDDVSDLWILMVNSQRKAISGYPFSIGYVLPVLAGIGAAKNATVILLPDHIRMGFTNVGTPGGHRMCIQ